MTWLANRARHGHGAEAQDVGFEPDEVKAPGERGPVGIKEEP